MAKKKYVKENGIVKAINTDNLQLEKPLTTDNYDINVFNRNMEKIDNALKNIDTTAEKTTIKDENNNFESDNVEGALEELFTSVSNGKSSIAQAITDKGVPASGEDTFNELSEKIRSLETFDEPVPMVVPTWQVLDGSITAICDTADGLFWQFRIAGGEWQDDSTFKNLAGNTSYTFEGKYGKNRVSSITVTTPKANQAKPAKPTASKVTDTQITVTAPSGCKIQYNNTLYNSPYTFSGLNLNTKYNFYAVKPATNNLNQSPVSDVQTIKTKNIKTYFYLFEAPSNEADIILKELNMTTLSVVSTVKLSKSIKNMDGGSAGTDINTGALKIYASGYSNGDLYEVNKSGTILKSTRTYTYYTDIANDRDIKNNKNRIFATINPTIHELNEQFSVIKSFAGLAGRGLSLHNSNNKDLVLTSGDRSTMKYISPENGSVIKTIGASGLTVSSMEYVWNGQKDLCGATTGSSREATLIDATSGAVIKKASFWNEKGTALGNELID